MGCRPGRPDKPPRLPLSPLAGANKSQPINGEKGKNSKPGAEPRKPSHENKHPAAMASAVLIQNWYRRFVARRERTRLHTWTIFQSLEYAGQQDQLRLYQLFNDMMTHLQPRPHADLTSSVPPQIWTPGTLTHSPLPPDYLGSNPPGVEEDLEVSGVIDRLSPPLDATRRGGAIAAAFAASGSPPSILNGSLVAHKEEEERRLYRLTDPKLIVVGALYKGPHLQLPMTTTQLQSLIEAFKLKQVLHAHYLLLLLHETRRVLQRLPNISRASTLAAQQITVCGDLHGKLDDLLLIFHKNGLPARDNPYVFNGDLVDRGPSAVEVTVLLFSCLLINQAELYVNRGNHEDHVINLRYGFIKEIMNKYQMHTNKIARVYQDLFSWLPLATIIDDRVLVCHGGVSDVTDLRILDSLDRHKYISVLQPPSAVLDNVMNDVMDDDMRDATDRLDLMEWRQVVDILWSDPRPQPGCEPNTVRGGGCYFGPDVTAAVLARHSLQLLIRSHECKAEGYEFDHANKLLTIFSASNYYELGSNRGAYVKLGTDLQPHIVQYMSHKRPGRQLTISQRIGIVEKSALRCLTERICSNRTGLLALFAKHDHCKTGAIKVSDWCTAMTSVLRLDLPWHSLRHKLVQSNAAGLVEYESMFDDFKIKHTSAQNGSLLTEEIYRNKDSLETIFRAIDVDHSGQISLEEFTAACALLGRYTRSPLPPSEVLLMARAIDLNHDGAIDFNEFLEAFRIVDQLGRDLHARRASEEGEGGEGGSGASEGVTNEGGALEESNDGGSEEGVPATNIEDSVEVNGAS